MVNFLGLLVAIVSGWFFIAIVMLAIVDYIYYKRKRRGIK
jgi:hypothetical protein